MAWEIKRKRLRSYEKAREAEDAQRNTLACVTECARAALFHTCVKRRKPSAGPVPVEMALIWQPFMSLPQSKDQ
jgi:hypothetical protein